MIARGSPVDRKEPNQAQVKLAAHLLSTGINKGKEGSDEGGWRNESENEERLRVSRGSRDRRGEDRWRQSFGASVSILNLTTISYAFIYVLSTGVRLSFDLYIFDGIELGLIRLVSAFMQSVSTDRMLRLYSQSPKCDFGEVYVFSIPSLPSYTYFSTEELLQRH